MIKKNLYDEISSFARHGIFSITDENKKNKYFQKRSGWFDKSFEKIDKEDAEKIFLEKEQKGDFWIKVYAIGIIALASFSILSATKEKFINFKNKTMLPIGLQNNILPSIINKISSDQILPIILTAYSVNAMFGRNKISSVMLMITLSFAKHVQAKCRPRLIGSIKAPGSTTAAAVTENYAYVLADEATPYGIETSFDIINITDPSNPDFVSSILDFDSWFGLTISGNYAYTEDGIVNITDPLNPKVVGTYDIGGDGGYCVAISGNKYAHVGGSQNELYIIDVTNPSKPITISSYPGSSTTRAIATSDNYDYLATDDSLQIINVTNLQNPTLVSSYPISSQDIIIIGKYACIATRSGLKIIKIDDPTKLTLVGSYPTPHGANCLAILDNRVLVGDNDGYGFQIINIDNPSKPTSEGSYSYSCDTDNCNDGRVSRIAIFKKYVFITPYIAPYHSAPLQVVQLNCHKIPLSVIILSIVGGAGLCVISTGSGIFCIIMTRKKMLSKTGEKKSLLVSS